MKWLAHLIEGLLYIVFAIGYLVLLELLPKDTSAWWAPPIAVGYVIFFAITLGGIFSLFPHAIRKYWVNKSPDNPEGCRDIFTYFADVYNSLRSKLK